MYSKPAVLHVIYCELIFRRREKHRCPTFLSLDEDIGSRRCIHFRGLLLSLLQ